MASRPTDGTPQPHLFPVDTFDGFGPSRFRPADEVLIARKLQGSQPGRLRRGVCDHAPRMPGVYGMIDARGRLIYVGKAKTLRARLLSYFRTNSRDPKAGKIIRQTHILVWEETGDEFAALLRELELIQTLRPKFNVLGVPGLRRYHYLCIGKSPAPHVYVTNQPTGKEIGVYGPLITRANSEEAARRLNDWFGLRDCPQTVKLAFSDQPELFPDERTAKCLRFELGSCRGPCIAACSSRDYIAAVRSAKAFLDGRDRTILTRLRELMANAAETFQFEKAMALRDRLLALEWIDARLSLLRQARDRHSFVYPLAGHDKRVRWYLIHRGQVKAVCFAPATDDLRERTNALIDATFASRASDRDLTPTTVDSVLLVVAWFKRNATEQKKLMSRVRAARTVAPV